jgi:hypothetical protein
MRAFLSLPLLLAACAAQPGCPAGTAPATVVEMAFGRNAGGMLRVTETDWTAFLAEEATPRFPDGLTVLDAAGQWRRPDGEPAREPSKLLWLVLPGTGLKEAVSRIAPLAEAYRARFGQESVLRSLHTGCAGF